jgi:threonine dehydratase
MEFSLAEVTDAQRLIVGLARVTPLIEAQSFSRQAGQPILLKLETLQPIGAFKIRGAAHALLRLDPEARRRGVCAARSPCSPIRWAAASISIIDGPSISAAALSMKTLLVSEEEIYRGMRALFRQERLVAEGGGAVGIAAFLGGKLRLDGPPP